MENSGIGRRIVEVQETLKRMNHDQQIVSIEFDETQSPQPLLNTPPKQRSISQLSPISRDPAKHRLVRKVKALEKELRLAQAAKVKLRQLEKAQGELAKQVRTLKAENAQLHAVVQRQTRVLHKQGNQLLLTERAKRDPTPTDVQAEVEFLRNENLELLRDLHARGYPENQPKPHTEKFVNKVVRLAQKHAVPAGLKPTWAWVKGLADDSLVLSLAASLNLPDPAGLPAAIQTMLLDQEEMLMTLNNAKSLLELDESATVRELNQAIVDKLS